MKSAVSPVSIVLFLLFAFGCATPAAMGTLDVDVRIEQLPDEGFAVEEHGSFSMAYQVNVRNRATVPVTLRRIEMKTTKGSPYQLRDEPASVDLVVEPGKEGTATFTMWSHSRDEHTKTKRTVWVNGAATFETPNGTVRKAFVQSFREP